MEKRTEQADGTIVAAITEKEERQFFPHGIPRMPLPVVIERPDLNRSSKDWARRLREAKTRILVSCWETESLDGLSPEDSIPSLEYICNLSGTVRRVVPRQFLEHGMLVTNWGGLAAPAVAEHALFLVLACLRRTNDWIGRWTAMLPTRSLFGRTVSIHGFGAVARNLVHLLKPFGVCIRCFSEGVPNALIRQYGVDPVASLKELASDCSVFIECEALTARTEDSVSADIIGFIPAGSVFVNVGRGEVADEEAILNRVKEGTLIVGLDVNRNFPDYYDTFWRGNSHIIISPHIAGPTSEQFSGIGEFGLKNIRRFLDGEPVQGQITLEIYDRAT